MIVLTPFLEGGHVSVEIEIHSVGMINLEKEGIVDSENGAEEFDEQRKSITGVLNLRTVDVPEGNGSE